MSYNEKVKKWKIISILTIGLGLLFLNPRQSHASIVPQCNINNFGITNIIINPSSFFSGETEQVNVSFAVDQQNTANGQYRIGNAIGGGSMEQSGWKNKNNDTNNLSFSLIKRGSLEYTTGDVITVFLYQKGSFTSCELGTYTIINQDYSSSCSLTISQQRDGKTCYEGCYESGDVQNQPIKISIDGLSKNGQPYNGGITVVMGEAGGAVAGDLHSQATNGQATVWLRAHEQGEYTINEIKPLKIPNIGKAFSCKQLPQSFDVFPNCPVDECEEKRIVIGEENPPSHQFFELCKQIPQDEHGKQAYDKCEACLSSGAIWTSIGCIQWTQEGIVGHLMKVGLGVAGGIALLMILAAAFLFAASEGEPKRTSEAKEILTAAIIGLVFIIFSITILEFIGVKIFRLPQFGG